MINLGFDGGHSEAYRVWLADEQDRKVRRLWHESGELDWNMFREIVGGGLIVIQQDPAARWSKDRVLVEYVAQRDAERIEYTLMVALVSDVLELGDGLEELELLDKCTILAEDSYEETYSAAAGVEVRATVVSVIESVGGSQRIAIPPFDDTLRTAMTWEPGVSKLRIVNDLLAAAGWSPLTVTGTGEFISRRLASEAPRHIFEPGPNCVASPEVANEFDQFKVPNKVIVITTTDGETEPLIGVAVNDSPESEWSTVSRGRTVVRPITDVEATSQEVVDQMALDYLRTSSQVTWRQEIQHLRLNLSIRDTVVGMSGQEALVVEMQQQLEPGALCVSTVRRMEQLL